MPEILVVSDSASVRSALRNAIVGSDTTVREAIRGAHVREAVAMRRPDLAILDMQIGSMGAVATCLDLHLEAGAGRLPPVPALILLDRRADVFLARQCGAEGWLLKPIDPLRLGKAVETLLGGSRFEDETHRPLTVTLAASRG